ncbi:MAG: carboxypeptidase-like regulatory domain-containing protein, partial [Draconibacterium sp.]
MKKTIQIMFLVSGLLCNVLAHSQTVSVSGTVSDSQGEPLPGVNVLVKGTTTGTVTNMDGAYSLQISPGTT